LLRQQRGHPDFVSAGFQIQGVGKVGLGGPPSDEGYVLSASDGTNNKIDPSNIPNAAQPIGPIGGGAKAAIELAKQQARARALATSAKHHHHQQQQQQQQQGESQRPRKSRWEK